MRPSSLLESALFVVALGFMPMPCLAADKEAAAPPEDQIEIDIDIEAIQDFVRENLPADVESPTQEEWDRFWRELEALLADPSLENLASFKPTADLALAYLAAIPELRDEADWLKQRMDFLDMADSVVRDTPVAPPVLSAVEGPEAVPDRAPIPTPPPPPPAAPPLAAILPPLVVPAIPEANGAAPVPAPLERQRISMIRSDELWVKKLAKRPLPANAEKLIPRLKAVFKAEGVPTELVWIAEVESSLNPDAKSPSGAVGLFQFMPATAERFGLRTAFFDERKDPEKSARAAARYLKVLYRQMGSWRLALASYNAGEGRVGRALEKQNAKSFDEIADHLPVETQMYVPKVMAVIALRENVDPAKLPAPAVE